ncbi:MAG: hypothetical protein GX629_05385 [Phycisphaerae bacterium]|jgi:hypothetical protein|nr:hypothetical protein [Phycisphaerae bacterium]
MIKQWMVCQCLGIFGALSASMPSSQPITLCKKSPATQSSSNWVRIELRELPDPVLPTPVVRPQMCIYVNTFDHSQYLVMNLPDKAVRIRYFSGSEPTIAEYDSRTKHLFWGIPDPKVREKAIADIRKYPMTLSDVKKLICATGAEIIQETTTSEQGLTRVDLLYMGGTSCAESEERGVQDTVWVSPADGQIRKLLTRLGPGRQIDYFPVKAVRDIYEVGVPRDAKVIECRPTASAAAVLDRLTWRAEKGWGSYVAVLTETDFRKSWGSRKMFLSLFARQNNYFLYATYSLQERDVPESSLLKLSNWPKPDFEEVLELTGRIAPMFFYATDGKRVWHGETRMTQPNEPVFNERNSSVTEFPILSSYCLTNYLWKGYRQLGIYGFGPAADTLSDEQRPNLMGLRLRTGDFKTAAPEGTRRIEKIFWIDPKRDDLPSESIALSEHFGPGNRKETTRIFTRYETWARTSSNLWYPQQWETTFSRTPGEKTTEDFTRQYNLQISTTLSIDPAWFASRKAALKECGADLMK